ncbi:MAG: hypothetical protein M0D57_17830 [Sphingobacteriales bacterium JAD_PAG50586_3]|nr:MAG: hypothetical protein M0D57_17830 [Sphingobacteriales bacterium JAD_PAG50586_3]
MKNLLVALFAMVTYTTAQAQFVAKMEVKEDIPGICDKDEVYALFPMFKGQVEPKCSLSKEDIQDKLNEIPFLKENPKFKGEGMMGLIINCKGDVVKCAVDNKTGKDDLDKQIEDVFKTLTEWTIGTLNGNPVDASKLYSYKIKGGELTLN